MELVEGQTLAERLKARPLAVQEALQIGVQIAEALEAAHEKGIIHRDLKPANIKITPEGKVKVLDFGLAKPVFSDSLKGDSPQVNTLTIGPTRTGVILGTPSYMSPEQARGDELDRRTDIWAFGCVLYEMLTGVRVFEGPSVSEIVAAVLKVEPAWQRLPADTPASIRRLLSRCLQSDRRQRLQWIADAAIEMTEALSEPHLDTGAADSHEALQRSARGWRLWALSATAILIVASVVGITRRMRPSPTQPASLARMVVTLPPGELLPPDVRFPVLVLSPDGSNLVSVMRPANASASTQLFIRRLDQIEFTAIPGTEDALNPFPRAMPDGRCGRRMVNE